MKETNRTVFWVTLMALVAVLFAFSTAHVLCDIQFDLMEKESRIRNHEIAGMNTGVEMYRLRNELAETKTRLRKAEEGLR